MTLISNRQNLEMKTQKRRQEIQNYTILKISCILRHHIFAGASVGRAPKTMRGRKDSET